MPKISVIVPCYNQAKYLDECLQSVLDQTYTDWECIIVNDGSTDNTEEIAKRWVEKDDRFRYLRKENGGVAAARNFGIENSNGEWILPLDGDDLIFHDYLLLASKEFIKDYDLIYCRAKFFGAINGDWDLPEFQFHDFLLSNCIFNAAFFSKKSWLKSGGYDEDFIDGMEDWEFWIALLKESSKKVLRLDYLGFAYRRKEISRDVLYNQSSEKQMIVEEKIFNKHSQIFTEHFGTFIEIAKKNRTLQCQHEIAVKKRNQLISEINTNLFTRSLFKIITLFSK